MPKKASRPQRRVYKKTGTRLFGNKAPSQKLLPAGKKARVKSNAIFKETKNRTDEEVHARFVVGPGSYYNQNPLAFHVWPQAGSKVMPLKLFSYDCMQQGLEDSMMSGRAVYSKYLKCKIHLKFPEGANIPQDNPNLYIVSGWIKTAPNLSGANPVDSITDPSVWTLQNDWDWIRDQLSPYFDERADKLRYIPKQNSNLAIDGYHRVKPKQRIGFGRPRTATLSDAGVPQTIGTLMDYHHTVNWKCMRKTHYEVGATTFTSEAHVISRPQQCWVNLNQWRPFVCLYCPDLGNESPEITPVNLPRVAYNSIHYYTDS